jgi:sigma-B regulation protein RsbU (phosphoserine phosphatase)
MSTVATETHELIPELCRHFSQLTGWRMNFTPLDRAAEEIQAELEGRPECCWLAALDDGSRPAGFLHLESPEEDGAATDFADAASFARTLARLLARLTRADSQLKLRNKDVSLLLNLGLAVPAQDDLAFALTQLLKAAVHLTAARSAAFFLLEPSTECLRLRALYRLERNEVPQPSRNLHTGLADLNALVEEPVILRVEASGSHVLLPRGVRTAVCAAVQSETVPFGTLWVYDRRSRDFSQRDVHVLQSIAAQVAAVLERSALFRASDQQARITRDLKAASETQPNSTLCELPEDPRYELAARCTSCYELGGDLCEVIALSPDRTTLAVGDASGNSIPAALIMSAVRGALRTHPADAGELTGLMSRLNGALCGLTRAHQFMSLCCGVFDAAKRSFTYSNAGHPAPLLVRNGEVQTLDSHGLLLGVVPEVNYQRSVLEVRSGDILVLYSDGITEARLSTHEMFRWEGISSTVLELKHGSAGDLLESIWNRVDEHTDATAGADDRTLLVLKVA